MAVRVLMHDVLLIFLTKMSLREYFLKGSVLKLFMKKLAKHVLDLLILGRKMHVKLVQEFRIVLYNG
jgi:hypothetical protein